MGNEQTTANHSKATASTSGGVSTSLSFLAGKKRPTSVQSVPNKKAGQVVVVRPACDPVPSPSDDEILKRFQEIPKFYPILKGALNQPGVRDPPDVTLKISHRPILRFAYHMQEHFAQCARTVADEQNALANKIKDTDHLLTSLANRLNERRRRFDRLAGELYKVRELSALVVNVKYMLQDLVPAVETMNELLTEEERLPALNLGRVLERSPPPSTITSLSSPSSLCSPMVSPSDGPLRPIPGGRGRGPSGTVTPTRSGGGSLHSTSSLSMHIEPIEELRVVDEPTVVSSSFPDRR